MLSLQCCMSETPSLQLTQDKMQFGENIKSGDFLKSKFVPFLMTRIAQETGLFSVKRLHLTHPCIIV